MNTTKKSRSKARKNKVTISVSRERLKQLLKRESLYLKALEFVEEESDEKINITNSSKYFFARNEALLQVREVLTS